MREGVRCGRFKVCERTRLLGEGESMSQGQRWIISSNSFANLFLLNRENRKTSTEVTMRLDESAVTCPQNTKVTQGG